MIDEYTAVYAGLNATHLYIAQQSLFEKLSREDRL